MNSLSWMIYLADVSGSLSITLTIILVVAAAVALFRVIPVWDRDYSEDGHQWKPFAKHLLKQLSKVALPLVLFLALMPSSGTVYAIAASEMGEDALHSETGGKAVQALNAWLDRQIAGESEAE